MIGLKYAKGTTLELLDKLNSILVYKGRKQSITPKIFWRKSERTRAMTLLNSRMYLIDCLHPRITHNFSSQKFEN